MDFHLINEKNLPKVANLWDYCFEKKGTFFFEWYFNNYCLKQNSVIGGFGKNGLLETMVHLNPYKIRLRGMDLQVSYLVGVATDPVARGRHALKELLEMTFTILRAQVHIFSILMAEYAGVYLPYQFAFVYFKHRYELPLKALTYGQVDEGIDLVRLEKPEDFSLFDKLYVAAMADCNGYVLRDERVWSNFFAVFLNEGGEILLAYSGQKPVGYMFYQKMGETFKIREIIVSKPEMKNNFLRFARQHHAQYAKLDWLADNDDLTYLSFPNQHNTGNLYPFMMARAVNVQKALEVLPLNPHHKTGSLVVLITDDLIKSNNSLIKLQIGESSITVENAIALPEVEMDVGAFTQLYFGQFSLDELAAAGKVIINCNEAGLLFSGIFPKCKNYVNEYY